MMNSRLFERFRTIAYEKAGICLKEGKEALVSARVAKRQRMLGVESPRLYLDYLEHDESGEELVHFLDAISTNYTSFFREMDHFVLLTELAKQWLDRGQRKIRLWCAASSSGEEPYSIVITMLDVLNERRLDFKLLATDISTAILAKAEQGLYDRQRLEPLTKRQLAKYFTQEQHGQNGSARYLVRPELRAPIVFKRLNLATPPYPMQGPLDMVFCRNVMMYFDTAVRQRLVAEIERLLRPGGCLVTGHSETLSGVQCSLEALRPSVYMKPSSGTSHVRG